MAYRLNKFEEGFFKILNFCILVQEYKQKNYYSVKHFKIKF